jgi:hypothetical protein
VAAFGIPAPSFQWRLNGTNQSNSARISGVTNSTLTLSQVQRTDAGSYSVLVWNSNGFAISGEAVLTVLAEPVIISQPQDSVATVGSNVTFQATAIGVSPLRYQWRREGTNLLYDARLSGVMDSSLSINSLRPGDAGRYSVFVTNIYGAVTSQVALLTVLDPPVFLSQPQSQTNFLGGNPGLSVSVSGGNPLFYQWLFNGAAVPGGTNATLSLSNAQPAQAGLYSVVVSNKDGVRTSLPATLTLVPILILQQPQSQVGSVGVPLRLSVIALGAPPLSLQWRYGGQAMTEDGRHIGVHTADLLLPDPQTTDSGWYDVVITNMVGSLTSRLAGVSIAGATNEIWTNSQVLGPNLTAYPFAGVYQFAGLTLGDNVELTSSGLSHMVIAVRGTLTLGSNVVIRVRNGYYPGAPSNVLSNVTWDNLNTLGSDAGFLRLYPGFYGRGGDGGKGSDGSCHHANAGSDVYCGGAGGGGGGGFGGGTGGTGGGSCSPSECGWGNSGDSGYGWGSSGGDGGYGSITFDYRFYGYTAGGGSGAPGGRDTSIGWNAGSGGTDNVAFTGGGGGGGGGNGGDGGGGAWAQLASGGDGGGGGGYGGGVLTVIADTIVYASGAPPRFLVSGQMHGYPNGQNGEGGMVIIQASNAAAVTNYCMLGYSTYGINDLPSLTNGGHGIVTGDPQRVFALAPSVPPLITQQPVSQTNAVGSEVVFKVVASGTPPLTYQWSLNGTNLAGATNATLALPNVQMGQAGDYQVVVNNSLGTATSLVARLTLFIAPPGIIQPPASQTVALGGNVAFQAVVGGSPPFTYQWWRNGTNLPTGTSATLVLTNVQWIDDGAFFVVVVANGAGVVTSSPPATLTVLEPPHISTPPASQTVLAAGTVTLSVTASGSAPLSYQWQFNGTNLAGATNATLVLTNVQWAQAGSYDVVVSNPVGCTTSTPPAVLAVHSPPIITQQPQGQTVPLGGAAAFSAAAVGSSPLHYQWQLNGAGLTDGPRVNGVATANLTISNLQASDPGDYTVVVTNLYGTATSGVARLTLEACVGSSANLVGWWPGDGHAMDLAGTNHGELFDGAGYASGRVGQAFSFPGGLSVLFLPPNALNYAYSSLSVEAWVFPTRHGHDDSYGLGLTAFSTTDNLEGFAMRVCDGYLEPDLRLSGGIWQPRFTQAALPLNAWSHIAITYDGANIRGFLNGELLGSVPASGIVLNSANAGIRTAIGNEPGGSSVQPSGFGWEGLIDELSVYSRALSPAEISAIASAGGIGRCKPPVILQQPQRMTTAPGVTCALEVTATGTAPLTYQWRRDGVNLSDGGRITGATSSVLTIANAQTNDAGAYSVEVNNAYGIEVSSNAVLSVADQPCVLTMTFTVDDEYSAYLSTNDNLLGVLVGSDSGSYSWVSPETYTANLTPGLTYYLHVRGTDLGYMAGFLGEFALSDNRFSFADGSQQLLTAAAGWQVSATGFGENYQTPTEAGSNGATPWGWISGVSGSAKWIWTGYGYDTYVTRYFSTCIRYTGPPVITIAPQDHVTASVGETVTLKVDAVGREPLAFQWQFQGASLSGATNATLSLANVQLDQAGDYRVIVSNSAGAVTSQTITLTVFVAPPVILAPLQDTVAKVGSTVSLSAVVGGSPPFQYQWYFNGTSLFGATNAMLVLPNVQTNQSGAYALAVWNSVGAVTSSPSARLTVGTVWIDLVSLSPDGKAILQLHGEVGKAYEVQASTDLVAWSTVGAVTLDSSSCLFTNMSGGLDHRFYRLHLLTASAPIILTQPKSWTSEVGSTVIFSVEASGYPFPWHQWQFNNADIPGQTNAWLTLPNVQTNQAGSYRVILTNSYGALTSQVATLTVVAAHPRILAPSMARTNGRFSLTLQSAAGGSVEIQACSNLGLTNWTTIATLTNLTGTMPFTDPATNFPRRFYRAHQLP